MWMVECCSHKHTHTHTHTQQVQYGVGSEISKDTIKTNRKNIKGMRVISSKSNNEAEFTSSCLLPDGHVIGATESSVRKNNIVWKAKSNEKVQSLSFVRNGKYIVCLCEDSSSYVVFE